MLGLIAWLQARAAAQREATAPRDPRPWWCRECAEVCQRGLLCWCCDQGRNRHRHAPAVPWHAWRAVRTCFRWRWYRSVPRAVAVDVRNMALRGEVAYGWPALELFADRMGDDGLWWWERRAAARRVRRAVRRAVREHRR